MQTTRDLADWIRVEHHLIEHLVRQLEEKTCHIPNADVASWWEDLKSQFERFRAHFERHIALEEKLAYSATDAESQTRFDEQMNQAKEEHREISKIMTSIFRQACSLNFDKHLEIGDCCCRIHHLVDIITHREDLTAPTSLFNNIDRTE